MASISFTCPNCAKVLRTTARPTAGKKIKCPSCETAFVPELDEELDEEETAIQDKPRAKAKSRSTDEEDDDEPRRKKSKADKEDEDPPSIKKKKKKKSSMVMILVLAGVGGVALLGCCGVLVGVGGWVWPGFFLAKGDLIAFVPADANVIMGGNPKAMRAKAPNLEKLLREQGLAQQGNKQNDAEDISLNSERMLAFSNTKDVDKNLVTIFQSSAGDIAKLKANPNLGAAQTIGGHANIHKATEEGKRNGLPAFVAFPGNHVVLMSTNSERELTAALARVKQPPRPNPTLELSRSVDKAPFWLAVTPDADTLNKLKQDFDKGGAMAPPSLRAAGPALSGIKGLTLKVDFDPNQDIKLDANVICKNADDAGKIKSAIEDSVNMVKGLLAFAALAPPRPGQPGLPPTLTADLNSLTFASQGVNVTGNMKISSQTVEALAKQKNLMGGGPFGPK